jgi:hypothetical protein
VAVQKSGLARFQRAGDVTKQRMIAASYGEAGSGKTTWWLGAPAPIVIQSFDMGLEGVVEEFAKQKDIYVIEYEMMEADGSELNQAHAIEVRDKFIADYEVAIQSARTVIWDRETDVWDAFKYAEHGDCGAGGATSAQWDSLKARLRRLVNMSKATDINFGLIQG